MKLLLIIPVVLLSCQREHCEQERHELYMQWSINDSLKKEMRGQPQKDTIPNSIAERVIYICADCPYEFARKLNNGTIIQGSNNLRVEFPKWFALDSAYLSKYRKGYGTL